MIISKKFKKKERLLESIVDIIAPVQMAQALSPIDLTRKYILIMSNSNLNTTKKLWLISIKKY